MTVQKYKTLYKRIVVSIVSFIIGVVIYFFFNCGILEKNNFIFTIIRNYCSDFLWAISFFLILINISENITKKYYLLTSVSVFCTGFLFEIMQFTGLAKGTFDLIDIFVYVFAVFIANFIEKYFMEVFYEKIV